MQIPCDEHDGRDAYEAQQQLTPGSAELHAECRPGIFDEVDDEPVAEDRNALIEFHVQFDGEFDRLVYDEQQDDEQGELRVRGWFAAHGMFRFLSKAAYGIRKYSNIFAEKHGTGRSAGRYAAAEPVFW